MANSQRGPHKPELYQFSKKAEGWPLSFNSFQAEPRTLREWAVDNPPSACERGRSGRTPAKETPLGCDFAQAKVDLAKHEFLLVDVRLRKRYTFVVDSFYSAGLSSGSVP